MRSRRQQLGKRLSICSKTGEDQENLCWVGWSEGALTSSQQQSGNRRMERAPPPQGFPNGCGIDLVMSETYWHILGTYIIFTNSVRLRYEDHPINVV
jgi:hypothetical protein